MSATTASIAKLTERGSAIQKRLTVAADEMVNRGLIGVAARITFPSGDQVAIASGAADMERSRALGGDELFAIASQSKMFTAACVQLLARDGAIKLSDPVAEYVPNVPAVDADATIDQLLNHTSGIGNFIHAMTVLPHPWPRMSYDDLMALARMHGRQFRAGARLDYNNTDVVVLAKLCENVSGQRFDRLLSERILRPLGMNETFVAAGDEWPRERMARGYYIPGQGYDGPPIDVTTLADYSIASAAGNIVSSLHDMTIWSRCLLGTEPKFPLGFADFTSNVADAGLGSPSWFMPRTYARGVESWVWGGRPFWGHRGSFFGYHSGTFVDPLSGVAFSMFLTMCTAGSFMRFIDLQAHDYMSFMASCAHSAIDALELA
ncbi:serine hydrolase domain-containing protein [Peristeroidobacter soli]|uniref:serine hydrolase domain-containing protein n=1 Tax=Peristeroidobacter soli TaxID=2497877 RepID=UPI00101E1EF1|nr:serine hydrolase domain-containing protein [Peristeroidobacter soli]